MFGKSRLLTLRIDFPIVVVVALAVVKGALMAGVADSRLAPKPLEVTEVMSVVLGGLTAGIATSCAPVLNWLRLTDDPSAPPLGDSRG
jgi:hypothetical protein